MSRAPPDRPPPPSARRPVILLVLLLGFILWGSLWPFRWAPPPPGTALVPLLLDRLAADPGGRGDILANLLLYVPLGLLLAVALPPRLGRPGGVLTALALGTLLSATVEALQLVIDGRVSSGADLALNAAGTLLGALLGTAMGGRRLFGGEGRGALADPVAALLVLLWLGWRLYPYVPSIDLQAWKDNLKPLLLHPEPEPLRTLQLLAAATAAALLAEAAAGAARARWLVPLGLGAALAAEVGMPGERLSLAEAMAYTLALPLWLLLRGRAAAAPVMVASLLAALLVERLQPFDFSAAPRPFGLVPFRSVFAGTLGAGVEAILSKLFLQGALLWWLLRLGLGLRHAAALLAGIVLAASLVQTRLPGRSAEITDVVLALGLALLFHLLRETPPAPGFAARRRLA